MSIFSKLSLATVSAVVLLSVSPANAVSFKLKSNASNAWYLYLSVNNGVLAMRNGSCTTKSATSVKVTGACTYTKGLCANKKANITVKLNGGAVTAASASGRCGSGSYRAKLVR